MNNRRMLLVTALLLTASACHEREKPTGKWQETDGAIVQRPECSELDYRCGKDCYVRGASPACTRCCRDQRYVCNTGHKADFESCAGSR